MMVARVVPKVEGGDNGSVQDSPEARKGSKNRKTLRQSWDLLFWVLGSFTMIAFTQFFSHILFNPAIKRHWLVLGVLCLCVCVSTLAYANLHYPSLTSSNWQLHAPILVSMATIFAVLCVISLWIAIWPVWKFYTLLMMPTLFMGFISVVSLCNL